MKYFSFKSCIDALLARGILLNVKYLLLLSFLTVAEFYNLWPVQGIIRVYQKISFLVICTTFRSDFRVS